MSVVVPQNTHLMHSLIEQRWLRTLITGGLFALIFSSTYVFVVIQEDKRLKTEFQTQVQSAVDRIRGQLWSGLTAVSTLAAVSQDGKQLSKPEFTMLASRIRRGQGLYYMMAVPIVDPHLAWTVEIGSKPKIVNPADRVASLQEEMNGMLPDFAYWPRNLGRPVKSALVQRVEPPNHAVSKMLGDNLLTYPTMNSAINSAIDNASAVIVDGRDMPELRANYLIVMPWYSGMQVPSEASDRRNAVSAVYVAAGQFFDISARHTASANTDHIDIKAIDVNGGGRTRRASRQYSLAMLSTQRQYERLRRLKLPGVAKAISLRFISQQRIDPYFAVVVGVLAGLLGILLLRLWFQRQSAQHLLLINAQKAQQERETAQQTLSMVREGIVRTDADLRIRYYNEAAANILGPGNDNLIGMSLERIVNSLIDVMSPQNSQPEETESGQVTLPDGDYLLAAADGDEPLLVHLLQTKAKLDGNEENIFVLRDVGDERQRTRELEWHATRDSLTGLLNRRAFEDQVSKVIAGKTRRHAVVYLDLDQFKVINDTAGHDVGDRMLQQVAGAIRMVIGEQHVAARLGGDEFGLLMCDIDRKGAKNLIERVLTVVRECHVINKSDSFSVGISAGVVMLDEKHVSLRQALSDADKACYAAKRRGRNRAVFFQPHDRYIAQRQSDVHWLNELKDAIAEDRFGLDVQPIFAVNDTSGPKELREVLLRMYASNGTVISPGQFIPVAEQHELMPQLDRWVISRAFQALAELQEDEAIVYSINLSSKTVNETDLTDFVLEQAKTNAIAPHRICFELTETSAVVDAGHTSRFLSTMRHCGFRIAIDDFGSGAASFSYLKKFPADILKVDRNLVIDAQRDETSATLLEGLNNLALTLGIATVAEGLETASMVYLIQSMGFTYGQGFFLGRPTPFVREDGTICRYGAAPEDNADNRVAIGV